MSGPIGFLLLMLGLGLRLDSTWQLLAGFLIVAGAVVSGLGFASGRAAFVPPGDTR